MTSLTDTQVVTASGGLVELGYVENDNYVTLTATSSASPDWLTPEMTVVCDGSPVLVEYHAPIARAAQDAAGTGDQLNFSLVYDGSVQEDSWGRVANRSTAIGHLVPVTLQYRMTPAAGSHTFRVGGYVSNASRNGYVGAGTPYPPQFLRVSKIVEATQWPAVTTGTIICTSSTRPASPFEGQTIYETDTDLSYTYTGSAWVQTGNSGAWQTYTPAFTASTTNPNLGSGGALEGRYVRQGNLITWQASVGTGGTGVTAGAGEYRITLPVAPRIWSQNFMSIGSGWAYAAGGWFSIACDPSPGSSRVRFISASGPMGSSVGGFAGAGQYIVVSGSYEAA